jgi:hypothetical protein
MVDEDEGQLRCNNISLVNCSISVNNKTYEQMARGLFNSVGEVDQVKSDQKKERLAASSPQASR